MTHAEKIQAEIAAINAQYDSDEWKNFIRPTGDKLMELAETRVANRERKAAEDAKSEAQGIMTMPYGEYKNKYSHCQTVPNSYDKRRKTIDVMTKTSKYSSRNNNGICPRCGTYCDGDCGR